MILYCIDDKHPLFGRRFRVETPFKDKNGRINEKAGEIFVDIDSDVPIDLNRSQLSPDPPTDIHKGKIS